MLDLVTYLTISPIFAPNSMSDCFNQSDNDHKESRRDNINNSGRDNEIGDSNNNDNVNNNIIITTTDNSLIDIDSNKDLEGKQQLEQVTISPEDFLPNKSYPFYLPTKDSIDNEIFHQLMELETNLNNEKSSIQTTETTGSLIDEPNVTMSVDRLMLPMDNPTESIKQVQNLYSVASASISSTATSTTTNTTGISSRRSTNPIPNSNSNSNSKPTHFIPSQTGNNHSQLSLAQHLANYQLEGDKNSSVEDEESSIISSVDGSSYDSRPRTFYQTDYQYSGSFTDELPSVQLSQHHNNSRLQIPLTFTNNNSRNQSSTSTTSFFSSSAAPESPQPQLQSNQQQQQQQTNIGLTNQGTSSEDPNFQYMKREEDFDDEVEDFLDESIRRTSGSSSITTNTTKSKQFECNECPRSFTRKDRLLKHQRDKHSDFTPEYVCEVCFKSYSTDDDLKRHKIVHTDRFKCNRCGKTHDRLQRYQNHIVKCKGPQRRRKRRVKNI
ncbi:hypothetical protein CANARDRAFT_10345 [[Candida] arabinofermentans NRRL YB-2248]|uniref:C2H2-type domain-containing protein n=1 Tax=[Candida] arabinofermentans NRRL YB-2248 TaxID=983967 RepID=A0A1E4ST47_9ASCO|nr:hypothetical protein CANARDRAFT_10345 [[Candida] arabinofermentans NRRL YB-2248]